MFTERVNTDLGELTDCDCLHQYSEQKQSSAGVGQLNLSSTCLRVAKRRKHTQMSGLETSLGLVNTPLLGLQLCQLGN